MPLFSSNNNFVLYSHIPKCGGSSLEKILKENSEKMSIFYADETHGFPCNPQHFQFSLLRHITPNIDSIPSFAVVRHPLLRVISEYIYKQKILNRKGLKPSNFSKESARYFRDYKFDPYIHDNHIRPQIEFVSPSMRIFKLESGLHHAANFALTALNHQSGELYKDDSLLPNILKSSYDELTISGKNIQAIQNFYSSDYEAFDYKTIDIPKYEGIDYHDLKTEILKNVSDKIQMEKVEKVLQNYQPCQHKLKPIMDYTKLTVQRLFKSIT